MRKLVAGSMLAVVLAGCAARAPQYRPHISKGIETRTGHGLGPEEIPKGPVIPDEVSLADGLTEDEAVAIALWNNAAFRADLATLGFARADLVEARLLRNPIFSIFFPLGPKQLEFTATWPLEALWQRPRRVAVAQLDLERVAEELVQNGLNLTRDTKVAYAELLLAQDRARAAKEALRVRNRIAELTEARLRAGDVSGLEASAARIDARQAEEEAARLAHEVVAARDRLRTLLGLEIDEPSFDLAPSKIEPRNHPEVGELVKEALAARPDLRAAELAMEAAGKRAGWERSKIFSIGAILDANAEGKEGFEIGPGALPEIPLFDRNQAGVARAEAEIERAARQYVAVRQQIVLEVQQSHTKWLQAREALEHWRRRLVPSLEETLRRSEKAYAAGEVSYLFVLETTRRLLEARSREAEATADLRRAIAQLDRSIGKKLAP